MGITDYSVVCALSVGLKYILIELCSHTKGSAPLSDNFINYRTNELLTKGAIQDIIL